MQYICDKKTCPCGTRCSNVPLNERQSIPEGKEGLKVVWVSLIVAVIWLDQRLTPSVVDRRSRLRIEDHGAGHQRAIHHGIPRRGER